LPLTKRQKEESVMEQLTVELKSLRLKNAPCECGCEECVAGNCEDCEAPDCDDPNCEGHEKSASEAEFEGLAAVYGNKDLGNDVIVPGAFAKSIAERSTVPLLWQHQSAEPIGVGKLSDSPEGLRIAGKLVLASDVAKKARALMKAGALNGLSIGFQIVKASAANGARLLQELRVIEVSAVTFPMNPRAMVTAVKQEPCAAAKLLPFCYC
jgi:HK97 family phage prohead protease